MRDRDLAAFVHHCSEALAIADRRGDKFLRYMAAMTLMAARQQLPPLPGEQVGQPVGLRA